MTLVLLLGAIAIVGAVVVRAVWRRALDERQSVRDYHQTLETLRHLSDRNPVSDGKPRPASSGNGASGAPAPEAGPARSLIGRSGPTRQSDPDAAPSRVAAATWLRAGRRSETKAEPVPPAEKAPPAPPKTAREPRPSPAAPSHAVAQLASGSPKYKKVLKASTQKNFEPPRRAIVAAAAIVFLAAVVAVAVLAGPSNKSPSPSASRSGSTVTHTTSGAAHHPSSPSHRSTTSTTGPPSLQPTTSTTAAAAYSAPSSTYVVALSASGPCWILASEVSSGRVIWTGTMHAGQTQQIPASGSIVLRLGAAFAVTVTLNGEPVILPVGHVSPFNVTFETT